MRAKTSKSPAYGDEKRPSDLGPKQLQWCRENLPHFQRCEEQALASKGERK